MANVSTFKDIAKSNVRKSIFLLVFMFFFVILIAISVGYYLGIDPTFISLIALTFALLSSVGGFWGADTLVLTITKAKVIQPEDNPQLHNLVEEMALASGIKKPKIAIVEDSAPNAFATGRDENHALIAFTTGILQVMDREQLQGVIAHEMAHIKNRDTLVGVIATVSAGLIAVLVDFSWRFAFSGRGSKKGGNPILLAVALISICLAPVAAVMIKSAITRKREQLADASAVAFTRNPTGLRRALEALRDDASVVTSDNKSVAHLYIESPLASSKISSLFDTHPPIQERIDLLLDMER